MAQTAPAARSVRARLGSLLNARSIALVGATRRSPWSSVAFRNCVDLGFRGRIHVVNPKGGLIHGQTAARSCAEGAAKRAWCGSLPSATTASTLIAQATSRSCGR